MNAAQLGRLLIDPTLVLARQGKVADPWQRELLLSADKQVLLNCCRQSGKSTVVSCMAVHTALFKPGALVIILSPTQRQSMELGRKIYDCHHALGRPLGSLVENKGELELENKSRIV